MRKEQETSVSEQAQLPENSFKLIVNLPIGQELDFVVMPTTTVQEIRQVVYDSPKAQFLTCFYLAFNGKRLIDGQELQSIQEFEPAILEAVPDKYTEHEARVHINRFREMLTYFKTSSTCYSQDQGATYASVVVGGSHIQKDTEKVSVEDYLLGNEAKLNLRVPDEFYRQEPNVVESIGLSAWNPPPWNRKMAGDFLYLSIETLEKSWLEVTCSVHGFYVNKSTAKNFDPTSGKIFQTLPSLLGEYSGKFKEKFEQLQKLVSTRHPFEYFMATYPVYPWLVKLQSHKKDVGRTLDASFQAVEALDTLCSRDWNDDGQSASELPKENGQERILRDQALFRSHSDFVDAALKGAVAIVNKTILPINPSEEDLSQMYIHNNIFFSQGYDNKEQFDKYGGQAAAHVAVSKDIDGIRMVNAQGLDNIYTLGTVLVDYMGHRIVAQTIVPGILKKSNSAESSIQYGSVDGGKEIYSDLNFKDAAVELGKLLHNSEHVVVDSNGQEHNLATSIETKWVQGTDGRRYVLDLYRLTPVDSEFLQAVQAEKDSNPYPHEMTLLRPELVELFYEHKFRSALKEYQDKIKASKNDLKEVEEEPPKEYFTFSMKLNPDSFTKIDHGKDQILIKKDQELVREASGFISVLISQMILDFVQYPSTIPLDGPSLTKSFHRRGINMRYLGKVAGLFDQIQEVSLQGLKKLLKEEMVSRVVKTLIRDELNKTPIYETGALISNVFNCLFAIESGFKVPATSFTPQELKERIIVDVKKRFRFDLDSGFLNTIRFSLIRSICLKVGIQIQARTYDLSGLVFKNEDIVNMYPIIKHAQPRAAFASEAYEHGRASISQDQKELGMELIRESVSMYEQIYGPIHCETGRAYANLGMLHYNDQQFKQALAMQRRAVIVCERTIGVDDPETLRQYINLAFFEFADGNHNAGIKFLNYGIHGWQFLSGENTHPELPTLYSNLAGMLMKLNQNELAISYLHKACQINEDMFGLLSPQNVATKETLTRAYFAAEDFRNALAAQQIVYKFHKEQFGAEDEKTKNVALILKSLTAKAVEVAKKQKAISSKKSKGKK